MSLNIKNEHVHELAREAARRTGRSQTSVIELALEQLLESIPDSGAAARKRARMDAVLADIRAELTTDDRLALATAIDELYDADGLPR